ncbi:MAG: hypothetical protein H0U65_03220 [Rubrobacter sp.]|nr:hypothetical protein [Rubrobacter sp.]
MAVNRNGLGKLYDRLTPEERFRLDVEATARGDDRESEKLVETCPRKAYTALDHGFSGRWLASGEISRALCLDLCQHLSRLQMLDALMVSLPTLRVSLVDEAHAAYVDGHEAGSRHAWKMAGMDGDPPGWKFEELPDGSVEVDEEREDPGMTKALDALEERTEGADLSARLLERLQKSVAADALTVFEGYRRFCEEDLGVEPEKMLAVSFEPILKGIKRLMEAREAWDLKPDEKAVAEYRAVLSELWKRQAKEWERLSG